jgi:hypothetical protein
MTRIITIVIITIFSSCCSVSLKKIENGREEKTNESLLNINGFVGFMVGDENLDISVLFENHDQDVFNVEEAKHIVCDCLQKNINDFETVNEIHKELDELVITNKEGKEKKLKDVAGFCICTNKLCSIVHGNTGILIRRIEPSSKIAAGSVILSNIGKRVLEYILTAEDISGKNLIELRNDICDMKVDTTTGDMTILGEQADVVLGRGIVVCYGTSSTRYIRCIPYCRE